MFKRRVKTSKSRQVANFFWPSIGFKRSTRYLGYRLARLPGTPYSLAAGFAFGAAVSFTPLVGLHFLFGGLLAWIFRANILASAFGTAIGNPWTFPFIWTALYKLGYWILGAENGNAGAFNASTMDQFIHRFYDNGWQSVSDIFTNVILPMFVGAIPLFVIVWIVFFYPLRAIIHKFHTKRAEALVAARDRLEQARSSLSIDNFESRGQK